MSGIRRRKPWWYVLSLMAAAGLGLATVPAQAAPLHPLDPAPAPVPAPPLDPLTAVAQVGPAVVDIDTQLGYQSVEGSGTGIVLDPGGTVLTNNHVVAGATGIRAVAVANGQPYDVDVLGYDRSHDIAVLQLRGAGDLPAANIGSSAQLAVGDPVIAVGNAGGQGGTPRAVPGRITALNQTVSASDEVTGSQETLTNLIKADTPIIPGDSGGPMVNTAGQVIGVNTAASGNFQFLQQGQDGYAIPIDQAMSIARQIRSGNASDTVHIGETAFLGVGVVDRGAGAQVVQVLPDTPAAQTGITDQDVITAVNGTPVNSPTELTNVLDRHHPGDTITLSWRGPWTGEQTAAVVLAPGPVG
jgi:S1-C subfamily serine protease